VSTGGIEARDWLSQPFLSLASNLVVPMVDWRRLKLQRDSVRTEVEVAALTLREVVGKSLLEVEAQGIERQRLQQQSTALNARVNDLRQAERVAEARFEAGAIARLDWLQARRARLAGEQEQEQLRLRRWLNHTAMYRMLGLEMGQAAAP
jgi:outer membrane protein TolC